MELNELLKSRLDGITMAHALVWLVARMIVLHDLSGEEMLKAINSSVPMGLVSPVCDAIKIILEEELILAKMAEENARLKLV